MTVVHLAGSIDHQTVPEARRHLLTQLDGDDLGIDLAAVTQIDTSGLAALVEVFQVARHGGRKVHLVHVSRQFLKLVRLARLENLFFVGPRGESTVSH